MISFNTAAQSNTESQAIRKLVGSFINDLNKGDFSKLPDYGTKEWIHINSNGGITYGRDEVVPEIFQSYKTNLKDAKIAIDNMTIRMLSPDAATVTVIHKIDSYTDSRGIKNTNQKQVKTYVVIKQQGKWLLSLDQSTIIVSP
jgi:uncharacterized protein (TIGR02246 family)